MIIRKLLEGLNRYDDIKEILNTIIEDNQYHYLINTFFVEDSKWHVYGEDVKKEASELLRLFDDDLNELGDREKDYENLRQYVSTKVCPLLHNYSLSLTYGNTPTFTISDIISWEILNYILSNLDNLFKLEIPKCWKKKVATEEDTKEDLYEYSFASKIVTDKTEEDSIKEDNKMSIKEKLLEAGRYDAILNILKKIIIDDQSSYPTDAYMDRSISDTKWRVDGEDIRKQAAILYAKISFELDESLDEEDYFYLRQYISTETCQMLHNYAVSISHRNDNPKEDMEVIRTWQILENLLFNLDDVSSWTIPNGWKADEAVSNRNKGIVEEQFKAMGLEIEENDEVHVLEWFVSTNGDIIRLLVEDNMYKVYCSDQLIATTRFTEDGYMQALEVFKVLQQDKECVWEFSELSPTVTLADTECGHNHVNFKSDMKRCPYCYGIITNK